jgi:hypothetical protein
MYGVAPFCVNLERSNYIFPFEVHRKRCRRFSTAVEFERDPVSIVRRQKVRMFSGLAWSDGISKGIPTTHVWWRLINLVWWGCMGKSPRALSVHGKLSIPFAVHRYIIETVTNTRQLWVLQDSIRAHMVSTQQTSSIVEI